MIKKYGVSIGEFIYKLNEKKNSPLKEVKQSTKEKKSRIQLIQRSHRQALVQKYHYLFDVQRKNIAMVLEVTYLERLHRA